MTSIFRKWFASATDAAETRSPREARRETPPWEGGLVLICKECLKKVEKREDGGKSAIKRIVEDAVDAFRETKHTGKLRLVKSECLDVCPKGAATLVAGHACAGGSRTCYLVSSECDPEDVLEYLRDAFGHSSSGETT